MVNTLIANLVEVLLVYLKFNKIVFCQEVAPVLKLTGCYSKMHNITSFFPLCLGGSKSKGTSDMILRNFKIKNDHVAPPS